MKSWRIVTDLVFRSSKLTTSYSFRVIISRKQVILPMNKHACFRNDVVPVFPRLVFMDFMCTFLEQRARKIFWQWYALMLTIAFVDRSVGYSFNQGNFGLDFQAFHSFILLQHTTLVGDAEIWTLLGWINFGLKKKKIKLYIFYFIKQNFAVRACVVSIEIVFTRFRRKRFAYYSLEIVKEPLDWWYMQWCVTAKLLAWRIHFRQKQNRTKTINF